MRSTAREPGPLHPFTGKDVPWLVDQQAATRPDKVFLIWEPFDAPRRTWTYAAFAEETKRYAAGLAAQGIAAGDFVTIHLENCPEFLFAWYACSRLGAVAVTTNTRSSADELAYFIQHSGSIAAITQPKFAAMVRQAAGAIRFIACTASDSGAASSEPCPQGMIAFETLRGDPAAAPSRKPEPMRPNSVQYTSGTTARPKGVVWTHANALWSGRVGATHARLTAADSNLIFYPLFHVNALAYSVLATLWSGGTAVLTPRFSASRFWDIAVRNRCTWTNMVAFTVRALQGLEAPASHAFRFWACAGDIAAIREGWGIKTIGWYGMTETVSQCIVSELDWIGAERSMGWPAPEYELQIRRADGSEAAFGEAGTLWIRAIRGVSFFLEYLNNPEATAAAFDADGWFDTGDQVIATVSGEMFFVGRTKDMLRVGAENVAALEIESVILTVPGVIETAVVGRPDRMLDEVPVAFVVAHEPNDTLKHRIEAICAERLADFKRPRDVIFLPELPKGLLDKVLKKELRQRLMQAAQASPAQENTL